MPARNKNDEGFALAAVMAVVSIMTILAFGGYFLAQNSLSDSTRVMAESRAFQVAESGLDRELSLFTPANVGTTYYPRYGQTTDGTYTVTIQEQNTGSVMGEYLLTSTGTSQGSRESVSMRFFYLDLWKMNISAGEPTTLGGGSGWNGQATIIGPLYVRGDFEWTANANYEEGPLLIRDGDLIISGSGTLGYESPIDLYVTGTYPVEDVGKQLFVDRVSHTVPDVTLPWLDQEYMQTAVETALSESVDNNMGANTRSIQTTEALNGNPTTYAIALAPALDPRISANSLAANAPSSTRYKFIGDGTSMSALGEGNHDLVIDTTSFGAWEGNGYPNTSGLHDDFAFNAATGTLYIEGVVFIDGDLTIGNNVRCYTGNGTLVVNGDVTILAGPISSDPAKGLIPSQGGLSEVEALGIVTPGDVTIGTGSIDGLYHGAVFCNGTAGLYGTATKFKGSLLAGNIYGDKPNIMIEIDPALPDVLPSGMPGAGGGMVFAGTWSRR